jgi:hypothetical protein
MQVFDDMQRNNLLAMVHPDVAAALLPLRAHPAVLEFFTAAANTLQSLVTSAMPSAYPELVFVRLVNNWRCSDAVRQEWSAVLSAADILQPWQPSDLDAPGHLLLQKILNRTSDAVAATAFRRRTASADSSSAGASSNAVKVMDSEEREKLYYISGYLVSTLIVRVFKRISLPQRRLMLLAYVKMLEAI